jgi:hypothetical protein
MQASLKTIGEEDKYFSKVSLRLESVFIIVIHIELQCKLYALKCPFHLPGCHLMESQLNLPY